EPVPPDTNAHFPVIHIGRFTTRFELSLLSIPDLPPSPTNRREYRSGPPRMQQRRADRKVWFGNTNRSRFEYAPSRHKYPLLGVFLRDRCGARKENNRPNTTELRGRAVLTGECRRCRKGRGRSIGRSRDALRQGDLGNPSAGCLPPRQPGSCSCEYPVPKY